jgi:mRNA-degrading endonuclease YafQ of YafQ-DinJ toxin-antitoxin module
MIFQGDASDIDPNSPTGQDLKQYTKASEMRSDPVITTRVMQELRINEPHDTNHQHHGNSGHLQPDQSSSRLTDMLNTVSPGRSDSHGEFRLHCPSAVPSPLHRLSGPVTSARSIIPSNGSFRQFPPAHPSKSVDDHFFMTNEHLDVVGKTTWDMLDATSKRQSIDANVKHDQMKELIEKRLDDIKSEINTVKEKAESTADNQHKVFDSLNSVSDILKENIPHALSEQDKKLTSMEVQIKELKQMMQALQKSSEQKMPEPKVNIPSHVSSPFSLPDSRSQPSSAGHYSELGRDGQPPMPHMHDNRNMASPQDGHNDLRAAYHKGYPQQWASRPGYSGHTIANKETNPYHFANGGQFNNGYGNGYSSFNYSPSPPEYPFNPGQAK